MFEFLKKLVTKKPKPKKIVAKPAPKPKPRQMKKYAKPAPRQKTRQK